MPTPAAPTAVDEQVRIIVDTAPKYFKGESDLTLRNHQMLRLLKQHGRIEFNAKEYSRTWNVKLREPPIRTATDGARIVFDSHVTDEQLTVDRRGYQATDKMTELEWMSNQGPRQIVRRYDRLMSDMKDAFDKHIAEKFYVNANSAEHAHNYQGVGTILEQDSSVAVTAADRVAAPKASYGGHSTELGYFGGEWDTSASGVTYNAAIGNGWPLGKGSSEYDAMSPMLINYASNAWGTESTSFQDNIEMVLSFLTTAMLTRTGYKNLTGAPMVIMCDPDLFMKAKNHFRDRNRQPVPMSELTELGLPGDSLRIDGCFLTSDYSLGGTGKCYCLCPQYLEMFNVHSDLYKVYGPEWTLTDAAYLMYASAYGNYRFQPKFFAVIGDFTD